MLAPATVTCNSLDSYHDVRCIDYTVAVISYNQPQKLWTPTTATDKLGKHVPYGQLVGALSDSIAHVLWREYRNWEIPELV